MINLNNLDKYRLTDAATLKHFQGWAGDHTCGAFQLPSKIDGGPLRILAAANEAWDHVSVSRMNRCPNWLEMSQIHRLFFKPDEVAMQLHVPTEDHINTHPHVLHLWRPHGLAIPLPPKIFV